MIHFRVCAIHNERRRLVDRSIVIDLPRGVSHWINAEFLAAVIKAVLIAERAWVPQLIGIIVGGILCTESMHRGSNLNTESGRLKERKRKRKRETSGTREWVARGGGGYRFQRLCTVTVEGYALPFFCFSSPSFVRVLIILDPLRATRTRIEHSWPLYLPRARC